MQRLAAELRHRELTQEIFDIGDEVASYIENLVEAIEDYDAELVADCLAELDEIIADARHDARMISAELPGLRHALTSGLRAGVMSARTIPSDRENVAEPVLLGAKELLDAHPVEGTPVVVAELKEALIQRTATTVAQLQHLVEWILDMAERTADDPENLNLGHACSRAAQIAHYAAQGWRIAVTEAYPGVARTMRGHKPPQFLGERARIDAIVAKVAARRRSNAAGAGAAS